VTKVRRAETTQTQTALTAANDLAIRHALETAGVEFIAETGEGLGFVFREPNPTKGK
jgi:hypothetical protein